MTLADALAALGRCQLRQGEAARLELHTEPGAVTLYALGARSGIAYGLVRGRPEDLDRLLDEAVAQVEGWRPPRGA